MEQIKTHSHVDKFHLCGKVSDAQLIRRWDGFRSVTSHHKAKCATVHALQDSNSAPIRAALCGSTLD